MDLEQNYKKEYAKLNPEQQQAVEAIEGPVIVLAGAGTGKTQTISLRIANILLKTQVNPSSILALTFTESGVLAMQKRLLSILGPTAYQVKIHTFHSYCNELVLNSPEEFSLSPSAQPITDLERGQVLKWCIDSLPPLSPLRPWGDTYFYQTEISSQIQTLKREGFSPATFSQLLTENCQSLKRLQPLYDFLKKIRATDKSRSDILSNWQSLSPGNDPFYREINNQFILEKNGYFTKTSDLKSALISIFDDLSSQLPKLENLASVYQIYQQKLGDLNRYDYDDMLLLVLQKFNSDPYFLSKQQEQNQYILVDEYQDTNTAQNQILYALGSYDSTPNLFVVGDDDQSIFRFQGASLENIYSFYQRFKSHVRLITLHHNYRSQPHVLTHANHLISQNRNRLTTWLPDLDKTPTPKSAHPAKPIFLTEAINPSDELYILSQSIKILIQQQTKPEEIVVLVKTNQQAAQVGDYLSSQQIAYFQENNQDIFTQNYILRFLQVLETCTNPSQENLAKLYAIKLPAKELFAYTTSQKTSPHLRLLNRLVARSQKDINRLNPHQAFLNILRRFKFLPQNYTNLFALNALSQQFYQQTNQDLNFAQILQIFSWQKIQKLPLSFFIPEEFKQNKVRVMTVHKAKGLEFEHVFLPFLNDKIWGNTSSRNKIKLPPGIISGSASLLNQANANEDERRLFYVAITRAKIQLYLSYSKFNDNNKESLPSLFLTNLDENLIQKNPNQAPDPVQAVRSYFLQPLSKYHKNTHFFKYLKEYLKNNYILTASDLNNYLLCPHCFYYQKILSLPLPKNKHLFYGTAIHTALTQYYRQKFSQNDLINIFKQNLPNQAFANINDYEEALQKGVQTLSLYYPTLQTEHYQKILLERNFKKEHLLINNVPVTGKIDKLKYTDTGLILSDFKTGKPGNYARFPEYERQLLFYYLLCEQSTFFQPKPNQLAIEYLTPNNQSQFETKFFDIDRDKLSQLKEQIQTVYQQILNLDFQTKGLNCPDSNNLHVLRQD